MKIENATCKHKSAITQRGPSMKARRILPETNKQTNQYNFKSTKDYSRMKIPNPFTQHLLPVGIDSKSQTLLRIIYLTNFTMEKAKHEKS